MWSGAPRSRLESPATRREGLAQQSQRFGPDAMQLPELSLGDLGELFKARVAGTREGTLRRGSNAGWQAVGSVIGHGCPVCRFGS